MVSCSTPFWARKILEKKRICSRHLQINLLCSIAKLITGIGRKLGCQARSIGAACTTSEGVKSPHPAYLTTAVQPTATGRRHGPTAKRLTVVDMWVTAALRQNLLIAMWAERPAGTSAKQLGVVITVMWDAQSNELLHCLMTARLALQTGRRGGLLARRSGAVQFSKLDVPHTIVMPVLTNGRSAGPKSSKFTAATMCSGDAQPRRTP